MSRRPLATRPRARCARGFTLVELMITVLVIGTAFIAGTWSMSATARTKAGYEQAAGPAQMLAQQIQVLADGLPRTPVGMVGAKSGAAVVALDSLIGASFSPPILSDASVAPGFEGWRQDVELSVYSLDDLTTPTADDPADGLDPESALIYRMDVTVLHDEEPVDTFSWWIHP